MRQRFDNMAAGVNYDLPPWELPPNVWSRTRNVRVRDGASEKFGGQSQVFGTALGQPLRLMPVSTGNNYYWTYGSLSEFYATDGVSHAAVTPAGGLTAIAENAIPGWTGGAFNGFLVAHNGTADDPFAWNPRSGLGAPATALPNWPATLSCRVVRPFRNYLFALRCTESGNYSPRLVRWSDSANPNNLPTTWDYTDPTNDAGRIEFGATQDQVIDLVPLRDRGVLYKENHTWAIQYVGGIDNPFVFRQVFAEVGMLSEGCAVSVRGQHIVLSTNDLVIHDLNQAESLINRQFRRWLFSQIDGGSYRQCFVVPNYKEREVWVCFPESGATFATLALVLNYAEGTKSVRELAAEVPHIGWGVINDDAIDGSFDGQASGVSFDDDTGPFDFQQFNPSTTSLLLSDNSQLYQVDTGTQINGQNMQAIWYREALPLDKDVLRFAYVKRIYPKVIGSQGDILEVRVGVRNSLEGPVIWEKKQDFVIGTDTFVNFRAMGRSIDIAFTHTTNQNIRVFGFDVEWDPMGYH